MANLSYCRFRNTLSDLQDCYDNIDNDIESSEEKRARQRLIELCMNIAEEYASEVQDA
jgi:hypothetical protein